MNSNKWVFALGLLVVEPQRIKRGLLVGRPV
jgi:hypothetical protein